MSIILIFPAVKIGHVEMFAPGAISVNGSHYSSREGENPYRIQRSSEAFVSGTNRYVVKFKHILKNLRNSTKNDNL